MKDRTDAPATYTGGDSRVDAASPLCHFAIALESTALGHSDRGSVAVLEALLGGGSAGNVGVGGGSLSRVSQRIVKQNPHVQVCMGFNRSFSDTGLFGIYGVCHAEKS